MRFPSVDDLTPMMGHRVVVRHLLRDDDETYDTPSKTSVTRKGPGATDVLGMMEHVDESHVIVRTADGEARKIAVAEIIAARAIPIRAVPRRAVRDLEGAAMLGWQATEAARYGGWLLRAGHGFTGRANSVLPLDGPSGWIDDAVTQVEQWYRSRGLPPRFQVIEPLGTDVTETLDRRGWSAAANRTVVMTASLSTLSPPSHATEVSIDAAPDDGWLAAYHYRGGALPAAAREIITGTGSTGPATLGFASIRRVDASGNEAVAAIGRGAVTLSPDGHRWLGVTAVEVSPHYRRQGLATSLMTALAHWARAHGATDGYVQVADENAAAQHMYEALGFSAHHHYHYRQP